MNDPLISIIMPVYNGERYLREAIDSILNQTFANFELIAIDDGSSDSSADILHEYQKRDSRIIIQMHENNRGIVAALNEGIQLARGEFIARMDADDISLPDRLKKEVEFLDSHPEIGVLSCNADVVNENGMHLYNLSFPETHFQILWTLCFLDPLLHPAILMRRSKVLEVGGYRDLLPDHEKGFPEDYELWTRMGQITQFYNLQHTLLKLRQHKKNITHVYAETLRGYSIKVCHGFIEKLLECEVKEDAVKMLWKLESPGTSIADSVDLIYKLSDFFLSSFQLTPDEKLFIKRDAAWKLINTARRHPADPLAGRTLLQALKYDMKAPVIILKLIYSSWLRGPWASLRTYWAGDHRE